MKTEIYLRKIFAHDTDHEISVTTEIVNNFFDVTEPHESKTFIGKKTNNEYTVTFNNARDWRFGGDFASAIRAESNLGRISEDDIIVIKKNRNEFILDYICNTDVNYSSFNSLFSSDPRHSVITVYTDENISESIDNASIRSKKIKFKNWIISTQRKSNGEKYADSYAGNVADVLQSGYVKFKDEYHIESLESESLYYIEDIEKYNEYLDIITNNPNYEEFNNGYSGDTLRQSLAFYKKYLESYLIKGYNKIYYGVPGCGKSYLVMNEWKDKLYERTTFYPDYTNSDFIGQIMPGLDADDKPTYEFVEGPFTKALVKAFNNPTKAVALIVEELNRGNAAAIFGEIFQLLDRSDDGESIYNFYNPNIIDELNKKVLDEYKPNGVKFDCVYIPRNLSIIATMNTSDQNVYSLDTAFQRRWKFEKIKNSFVRDGVDLNNYDMEDSQNYVSSKSYLLANMFIPAPTEYVRWMDFVNNLNKDIRNRLDTSLSNEDKQIGIYFLSENELMNGDETDEEKTIIRKAFEEKMLKYIWEDIAKTEPEEWFNNCKCLDDVFKGFEDNEFDVFKNNVYSTDDSLQ